MITREAFISLLEAALTARGVPVRRYSVEPGLEDLEAAVAGVTHRLRIVRTGPR